jgi:perosamine synthetase
MHVALTSSGRGALAEVLSAFKIGPGDEVIIQAFTCLAVPAAVRWIGAKVIYADIDAATYNFDVENVKSRINDRTAAIVVQHTFGIPGPIDEIVTFARDRNIVVIEDCAHALGAKIGNRQVGTMGDAAILSFGRDKTISSVLGGAVLSKRADIIKFISDNQSKLPYPPSWWVAQQLLHPILFILIKKLYFTGGLGKMILVGMQRLGLLSKAVTRGERIGGQPKFISWRFSPALGYLLLRQLKKLDRYVDRRRIIADRYFDMIPSLTAVRRNASWLRVPMQIDKRDLFLKIGRKNKIIFGDWYQTPVAPGGIENQITDYISGSCPVAESSCARVINLPTYPTMTDDQVAGVIRFVSNWR